MAMSVSRQRCRLPAAIVTACNLLIDSNLISGNSAEAVAVWWSGLQQGNGTGDDVPVQLIPGLWYGTPSRTTSSRHVAVGTRGRPSLEDH